MDLIALSGIALNCVGAQHQFNAHPIAITRRREIGCEHLIQSILNGPFVMKGSDEMIDKWPDERVFVHFVIGAGRRIKGHDHRRDQGQCGEIIRRLCGPGH